MNVKRKALRLRKAGKLNEMFLLLSTQPKGETILNEILDNDEIVAARYVDWSVNNIIEVVKSPVFGLMNTDMQLQHSGKYQLFKLLNKGVRNGGKLDVSELRPLLLDMCGPDELERFEWLNPEILQGETVDITDYLKAAVRSSFMIGRIPGKEDYCA